MDEQAVSVATADSQRTSQGFRFRDPSKHGSKSIFLLSERFRRLCLRLRCSPVGKKTGINSFSSGLVRMAAGKLARLDEELGWLWMRWAEGEEGVIVDFALGTLRLVCARRLVNPNGTLRIKVETPSGELRTPSFVKLASGER